MLLGCSSNRRPDAQDLAFNLLSALQILPAVRFLHSKIGYSILRSDLLRLNSVVDSDDFDRLGGVAFEQFDVNENGLQFVSTILGSLWMNEEQLPVPTTIIKSWRPPLVPAAIHPPKKCLNSVSFAGNSRLVVRKSVTASSLRQRSEVSPCCRLVRWTFNLRDTRLSQKKSQIKAVLPSVSKL